MASSLLLQNPGFNAIEELNNCHDAVSCRMPGNIAVTVFHGFGQILTCWDAPGATMDIPIINPSDFHSFYTPRLIHSEIQFDRESRKRKAAAAGVQ